MRHAIVRLAAGLALLAMLFAPPARAESVQVPLHAGLPDQDRVGKLAWRGGIELDFEESRFGGVSAIELGEGGGTMTLLTDRGDWARIELVHDAGGRLVDARLLSFEPLTGAGGRSVTDAGNSDIEAIARMPDGGWIVALEGRHRLLHFPASRQPLRGIPRLLAAPRGLERAAPGHGIKAAAALEDRRVLLISEDLPPLPGFTTAWIGNGADWTPMSYTLYPPFRPVAAAPLPNGDVVVVEHNPSSRFGGGSRIARIDARRLRPGAPIQTTELARLRPPWVSANFEAVGATRTLAGQPQIYLASDNGFDPDTPTVLVMFDVLP